MKKRLVVFLFLLSILVIIIYRILGSNSMNTVLELDFNEIAYIRNGNLYTMSKSGNEQKKIELEKFIQGNLIEQPVPQIMRNEQIYLRDVVWSFDGNSLGFLIEDPNHTQISYPGMITEDGKVFTCDDPSIAGMSSDEFFQIINGNKVLLNSFQYDRTKIIILDLENCDQSVYYEGRKLSEFSISSNSWLAVNELVEDEFKLNVYDENRNLVLSENTDGISVRLAWSKKGDRLVFGAEEYGPDRDIDDCNMIIYDFSTNEIIKLPTGFIIKATFSPDGNTIMYMKGHGIYTIDIDSLEVKLITEGENPSWRP